MRNYFCIDASLVEINAARYTPAGLKIIEIKLLYTGRIFEACKFRNVEMSIFAVLVGDCCDLIQNCDLGSSYRFIGFLAPRRRGLFQLVFHIQKIRIIESV